MVEIQRKVEIVLKVTNNEQTELREELLEILKGDEGEWHSAKFPILTELYHKLSVNIPD